MKKLSDYKEQYFSLFNKRVIPKEKALEVVKKNGLNLEYVEEQTEEICLAALENNINSLQFVNKEMFEENSDGK